MHFDDQITRTGTHSVKWDNMEDIYGVPSEDGLPMWVADMDFRPPQTVQDVLQKVVSHGIYGYTNCDKEYRAAICWWMKTRHNWEIDPSWIFTTTGHGQRLLHLPRRLYRSRRLRGAVHPRLPRVRQGD